MSPLEPNIAKLFAVVFPNALPSLSVSRYHTQGAGRNRQHRRFSRSTWLLLRICFTFHCQEKHRSDIISMRIYYSLKIWDLNVDLTLHWGVLCVMMCFLVKKIQEIFQMDPMDVPEGKTLGPQAQHWALPLGPNLASQPGHWVVSMERFVSLGNDQRPKVSKNGVYGYTMLYSVIPQITILVGKNDEEPLDFGEAVG